MKKIIKKIKKYLPVFLVEFIYFVYEKTHQLRSKNILKKEDVNFILKKPIINNNKKRVLFYHKDGLSFGGTEKFLQIIAKYLPKDKFEVFFMAHWDAEKETRFNYLKNEEINFINFSFSSIDNKFPYFIHNQTPNIFSVIRDNNIDLIITASAGYAEYPLNIIQNIPIVLIGVFGYATVQKNVKLQVYISEEVGKMVSGITNKNSCLMPILSEDPSSNYKSDGLNLRSNLGISDNHIVFGRIGRDNDGIFDAIGINAFKMLLKDFNNVSYLIMSPPPILREIVKTENIKNVYFLNPSSNEKDIWSFHNAIDVLAHFRKDGESQGLNIVESMLCSKPIITHKSDIWNAHLEYLDKSFSRVADKDNINQYYEFMKEMVLKDKEDLRSLGQEARKKAEKIFLIKNRLPEIISWLDNIV